MYSTGKFAKLINKSVRTLQRWDRENIFKPDSYTLKGHRSYSHKQYLDYLSNNFINELSKDINELKDINEKMNLINNKLNNINDRLSLLEKK